MSEAPPLAGVVGWPIGHSRSPRLHGHWLAATASPATTCRSALRARGLRGGVPRAAAARLPRRQRDHPLQGARAGAGRPRSATRARAIGAANTMTFGADGADPRRQHRRLRLHRQPAPGGARLAPAAGPALVLGAGGAARAVVAALLAEGAPEIRARQPHPRPRRTAARRISAPRSPWSTGASAAPPPAARRPSSTPPRSAWPASPRSPLASTPRRRPRLPPTSSTSRCRPRFLAAARARGLAAVDGLGMLLHQAVPGFERWFGVRPEVDDDLRAAVLADDARPTSSA